VETANLTHSLILNKGIKISITGTSKGEVAITGFFEGEDDDLATAETHVQAPRKASAEKHQNGNGVAHAKQEKHEKPAHKSSTDSKDKKDKHVATAPKKEKKAHHEEELEEDFDSDEVQGGKKRQKITQCR